MDWVFKQQGEQLLVDADVSIHTAEAFCRALREQPVRCFDFAAVTIEDGESMAYVISAIREMQPVSLIEAPQMLAHGLYKIGALARNDIVLIRPRVDEGQGA